MLKSAFREGTKMHFTKIQSKFLPCPQINFRKDYNMQVYDTANRLASEIKESEEYINFKMAKQAINLNLELKKKLDEFEKARYEEQIEMLQNGKHDEEKIKKVQEIYAELIEQEEAKKYFDAELKFNILIGDVNKIIAESVKDLI